MINAPEHAVTPDAVTMVIRLAVRQHLQAAMDASRARRLADLHTGQHLAADALESRNRRADERSATTATQGATP